MPADPAQAPRGPLYAAACRTFIRVWRLDRAAARRRARAQGARVAQLVRRLHARSTEFRRACRRGGVDPAAIRSLDDLPRLPVLERDDLRRLVAEAASWPETRDRWVAVHTSGSSGEPLALRLTLSDYAGGLAIISYGFLRSGARVGDHIAHLCAPSGGSAPDPRWLGLFRVSRLDLREPPERTIDRLRAGRPAVVYGHPSHLTLLAQALIEASAPPPGARLVITNGEVLTPAARALIGRAFRADVRDSYGSAELPRVAYECPRGLLHVVSGAVVIEVDPATIDGEGFGDVLVTSLVHRAPPLLRYRLGDRVQLAADRRCACGAAGPLIAAIAGRCDDWLVLPSGRRVSARAVNLLDDIPGVREHQIVQTARDAITVWVAAGPGFGAEQTARIRALLARGLGGEPVTVEVRTTAAIPRGPAGKRRAVRSEAC